MQISSIHKAKTHLSDLIKKAQSGEEIIICNAGRPAVKLVKYEALLSPRKSGIWKNQIKINDDFDELPLKLLKAFNGEE